MFSIGAGGVADGVGVWRPGVEPGVMAVSPICRGWGWRRNCPVLEGGDWTGNMWPMDTCWPPWPPIIMLRGPRPGGDWCWWTMLPWPPNISCCCNCCCWRGWSWWGCITGPDQRPDICPPDSMRSTESWNRTWVGACCCCCCCCWGWSGWPCPTPAKKYK